VPGTFVPGPGQQPQGQQPPGHQPPGHVTGPNYAGTVPPGRGPSDGGSNDDGSDAGGGARTGDLCRRRVPDHTPLVAGTYEVEFVDARDNRSFAALFSVGAETVEQVITNDTGAPICEFNVTPAEASVFSVLEFNPPFAEGVDLVIDVPDVELAAQSVLCDGETLPVFSFAPTSDVIGIAAGAATPDIPPTTPEELFETFGRLESYDRPLPVGPDQDAAITDIAINSDVGGSPCSIAP
jgi:hypothetical protein